MSQQLKEYTKKIDFSKCTDKNDIIMSFNKSITNLYEDFYGKEMEIVDCIMIRIYLQ